MKIDTAELTISAHRPQDFVRDGLPQVAFVGRSNVGKSSLLNRLLGRRGLARISSTPGRTRSINYFVINRRFYFVDLPGYGYAKAGKADRQAWAELIGRYFHQAPDSASRFLVIQLVDGKVGATRLDAEAFEYLTGFGVAIAVVATKIDKVGRSKRPAALARIGEDLGFAREASALPVSARSGEGIKELWTLLDDHLELPAG